MKITFNQLAPFTPLEEKSFRCRMPRQKEIYELSALPGRKPAIKDYGEYRISGCVQRNGEEVNIIIHYIFQGSHNAMPDIEFFDYLEEVRRFVAEYIKENLPAGTLLSA